MSYAKSTYGAKKYVRRRKTAKKGMSTSPQYNRWMKNIQSIPNAVSNMSKYKRFQYTNSVGIGGGELTSQCITDFPQGAQRSDNTVNIKSFDVDLHFTPFQGCIMPTWVRFAVFVQTGKYESPINQVTDFLEGIEVNNSYLNISTAPQGWILRTQPLNPRYKVIYAKTVHMGPLLEAGANTIQSNLEARCHIKQHIVYNKRLAYDTYTDNVASANNVFAAFWFDDDFRLAGAPSSTSFKLVGEIQTNYNDQLI